MMKKRIPILSVLLTSILISQPAYPAVQAGGLFSQGSIRAWIIGGVGRAFDQSYFIVGGGAGYYLIQGLEAGVDLKAWLGNDPGIYEISPQVRYVITAPRVLKPYLGVFYSRTIYEDLDDLNSLGLRLGVYNKIGSRSYLGFGFVSERLLDCDDDKYDSCTDTYPEITLSLTF